MQFEILALIHCEHEYLFPNNFWRKCCKNMVVCSFQVVSEITLFCLFDKFSEVSPVSCSTLKFLFVQICKTTCPFTKKGLILTLDVFFHKTICRYPTKFFVFRKKYEKSFIFCLTLRRKHSNIAVEI